MEIVSVIFLNGNILCNMPYNFFLPLTTQCTENMFQCSEYLSYNDYVFVCVIFHCVDTQHLGHFVYSKQDWEVGAMGMLKVLVAC